MFLEDLHRLREWATELKMKLSVGGCKMMHTGTKKIPTFNINCEGNRLRGHSRDLNKNDDTVCGS